MEFAIENDTSSETVSVEIAKMRKVETGLIKLYQLRICGTKSWS